MAINACIKAPKLNYERHKPKDALLYQTIEKNLPAFMSKCEADGHPLPSFIKREFEAYLKCGVLDYGFARVYCQECQYDRLIPFSCKKRGFCGSCLARRMSEISVRLVDTLIPEIPTRQWVLSLPAPLRYLVAYDNDALKAVLTAFTGCLFSHLRRKAKKSGGTALDADDYFPGAITFIQRFGSALNLNLHMHSQVSDGVYVRYGNNKLRFIRVAPPSLDEIKDITLKIAHRVHRYLKSKMEDSDALLDREPLLAKCYTASLRYLSALGENAGKPLLRLISPELIKEDLIDERTVMGFNLHASDAIEAHDRNGLERTLRYMGRPPLAMERLKLAPDDKHLVLTLKTPWRNGMEKILMTPFNLLERLVAIIPPPRKNQVRYHGFFGPHAKMRGELVPSSKANIDESSSLKVSRPGFAQLMSRVFDIDILCCPRCHSKMQLISFITEPKAIKDILRSMRMSTAPPEVIHSNEYSVAYEQADLFIDDFF